MASKEEETADGSQNHGDHQGQPINDDAEIEPRHFEYSKPKAEPPDNKGQTPPPKDYDKTIARWTAVVGAFTVVLAVATIASTVILLKTDDTLQDTMQNGQRAYAYIVFENPIIKANARIELNGKVRIAGQTPAYDVVVELDSGISNVGAFVADAKKTLSRPPQAIATKEVVGGYPGDEFSLPYTGERLTPAQVNNVYGSDERYFVFGRITYKDIFSCRHFVRFCYGIGGIDHIAEECPVPGSNTTDPNGKCQK